VFDEAKHNNLSNFDFIVFEETIDDYDIRILG